MAKRLLFLIIYILIVPLSYTLPLMVVVTAPIAVVRYIFYGDPNDELMDFAFAPLEWGFELADKIFEKFK